MDNDTSTCSVRSSSVKVQKIFDQYMAQIAPIANLTNSSNKENSFCISNDQRSNYHTRIQTPDKTTQRNSSQVQVIQALQKRNQDLKIEIDSLKEQLKSYQNQHNTISELSTFYQNLQQQYAQLDKDHKLLLQSYELQLSQLKQEKDLQVESLNKLHKQQIEDLKLQMSSQFERYKNIEGCRVDQEKLMSDTLDELRKERQLIAKLKLDQRLQLEECEQQNEKQLQYQQKLYQEMKAQNNLLQKEKVEQQTQINELESTYKDLVQHQKQEIVKWQKQYSDIKSFFEAQMKQVQEQVSNAMSELRGKNESYLMQLSEQEQIIEDLEDMNQQLKSQILFKDQEILGIRQQLEQLQIQHEKLKIMNDELIHSFNNQIEDLSLKLEREREQSETQSSFNEQEKQEIYNAVHNEKTLQMTCQSSAADLLAQQDNEYKQLLQQIIDVEKEAYRLNNQYQSLFQQFSKGGSEQEKPQIKQEMTDLMQQIRVNNSRLYELKAKEFTYLS